MLKSLQLINNIQTHKRIKSPLIRTKDETKFSLSTMNKLIALLYQKMIYQVFVLSKEATIPFLPNNSHTS